MFCFINILIQPAAPTVINSFVFPNAPLFVPGPHRNKDLSFFFYFHDSSENKIKGDFQFRVFPSCNRILTGDGKVWKLYSQSFKDVLTFQLVLWFIRKNLCTEMRNVRSYKTCCSLFSSNWSAFTMTTSSEIAAWFFSILKTPRI